MTGKYSEMPFPRDNIYIQIRLSSVLKASDAAKSVSVESVSSNRLTEIVPCHKSAHSDHWLSRTN